MPEHEVSHGDIYHKLGSLEGKLDAMSLSLIQKREDMNTAFDRIRNVETALGKIVGACLILSLLIPLLVTAISPRLHFGDPPAAQADER
jgi:hypothetical protein